MSGDAWQDYLAAAQRLDAVRRTAATAAGEQAQGVRTAREELTGIRARLVPQQSRLRALGVPEGDLRPSGPEVAAAGRAMAAGPEAVLAALREARATADAADSATEVPGTGPLAWSRMLLYGAYALGALLLLVVLCVGGIYLF
ncbi:hypothetical protein I0C86_42385 [Plantactinospora sp. S1510]|uniref:Uncharacterized protein n=1 Tax=Plantactinospora alkalitolerans TaxID=2789879 RepID=A0ABS0HAK6_9ACTN|nr:hypothetical protein [Plantactinospora alkalitolerans]MBF9135502.1 hypothetical protein [Plantactinospora alkalitolerans]